MPSRSRSASQGNGRGVKTAGQPDISGGMTLTGRQCRTCPGTLTPTDVAHGIVRCKRCRKANPGNRSRKARGQNPTFLFPKKPKAVEGPRESWWADVPASDFYEEAKKRALAMNPIKAVTPHNYPGTELP